MPETPDDIQRQIAQLEAMRATLGDAMVDDAIAKLRGQQQHAGAVTGTATTSGHNYGQNIGVNLGVAIFGRTPDTRERERLGRYLHHLACALDHVPLRGLEQRTDQRQQVISLPKVYTLLATTGRVQVARGKRTTLTTYLDKGELRAVYAPDHALPDQAIIAVEQEHSEVTYRQSDTDDVPVTLWRSQLAAEAVAQQHRLVLLGDPGGGKSTFLRHLGWLVAQHTLGRLSETELALLPADLHDLLPIMVPLPQLARALGQAAAPDRTPEAVVTDTLMAVMREYEAGDLTDHLSDVLYRGSALVLFDGLDEVPTEPQVGKRADRATTLQAVQAFAYRHRQARMVVTCRTRAFEPLQAALSPEWHTTTLAPFTLGQMRYFVEVWYDELAVNAAIDAAQIASLKQMLVADIQRRPRLREMAETPLLLTMMALVLYNKGELPRDRPKLYEAILDLLLEQWDRVREGQTLTDVVGWRDWTSERIRPVLDRLSYEAHRDATSADGRGRLSKMAVEWALRQHLTQAGMPEDEAAKAATRVARYMEQRSGLLQPAADDYEFAHLTLQEHCAGRHLVRQSKAMPLILEHRVDDRWREPIFLGLGTIQEGNPWLIESVLRRLIQRDEQQPVARWYRDLILAAEIGEDRDWAYLKEQGLDIATIQRDLRSGLATLLNDATQPLPVAERVRAGFLLGELRDPRFPVTIEEWRAEAKQALHGDSSGYFCKVEPGTYIIGSGDNDLDARCEEKPQHTVTFNQPFWIARFPITNAQWKAWVAAGGKQSYAADASDLNHSNQPVVGVSWSMCRDFCRWLSERTGLYIRLPSEAEWETAARGGDARRYPWSDEWRNDHAATEEDRETRGTPRSTPVGCYPVGTAPCGALDMAGNVWEWTHTPWMENHDPPRSMEMADDAKRFTLKRGSHRNNRSDVRCATRYGSNSGGRIVDGFRVLISGETITNQGLAH
jgi:formylglycine-generating enzyme required for sulfatase activity/energy-coupling factor transporter ATP-binding protein EcfA2